MLTNTIKQFIAAQIERHPQIEPWLGDWELSWETQIMADVDGLDPCYGKGWHKPPTHWVDNDGHEHWHIRIPRRAETENPRFHDYMPRGPIHQRWILLGTTGWNWTQRKSMFVGFDFDSIANHGDGLDRDQLNTVLERALSLPYVIARTSKSGQGIHLLVPLTPWITTRTHTQHSSLAKHVLCRMSSDCGFDFHSSADVCGGNLWHFEKGLSNDGLRLIDKRLNH